MKKRINKILLTFGSMVLVVGVGVGTYYLVKLIQKKLSNWNIISEEGKKSTLKRMDPIHLKRNYESNQDNKNEVVYVDLIEYKYEGKYFLGYEGLKKLNEKINNYLPFSSEIDQLKYISINDVLSLPSDKNKINGQYDIFTMELDIDTRKLINSNESLEKKVDLVFATILHEYGHHLSNTYITSNQYKDDLIYDTKEVLVPNNNIFLYKFLPKTFFERWINALNYDNVDYQNLEKEQLDNNVYKNISSKSLFEAANYGPSNLWTQLSKDQTKYEVKFDIFSKNDRITHKYDIKPSDLVNYNYGVDELFTRHLVTLNYINESDDKLDYFLYKINKNNSYQLNSFAPDIFQRNNLIQNDIRNIYSIDNIFGGLIVKKDYKIQKIESKANAILQAYRGVFGYGKLISQIYMDNSNNKYIQKEGDEYSLIRNNIQQNDFNKIKIGGYIPKNKNIKSLVLKFKDGTMKNISIYKIFSKPLKAKTSILSKTYQTNPDDDSYVSYISEQIDFNKIDINKLEDIVYWEDSNSNNIQEDNENKTINENEIVTERNISSFREAFKRITHNKKHYVYKDAENPPIYYLYKDKITKKILFKQTNT